MSKKKISVYLTNAQLGKVALLAVRTHRTIASHIREALDSHLKKQSKK